MAAIFVFFGLLIFCAHVFSALFSKKRIPDVLFLVVIGILLGPVFGVFKPDMLGNFGPLFSSLTLVLILFDGGVDLSIDALRKYWKGMMEVTMLSFLVTMAIIGFVAHAFGFEWRVSFMMGSMLGGTAAAIVIPLVKQMKVSEYARTVLSMESAMSSMLCMVVALAFIDSFQMDSAQSVSTLIGKVVASFIMALLIGVVGGIVWSSLLDRVRTLQNSMFLTPAFLFVLYGLSEWLGYNGAIAVLAFGVVLGNTDYFEMSFLKKMKNHHKMMPLENKEKSFFKELVFICKTFFFVYIGICIPFGNFMYLLFGAVLTVAVYAGRFLLLFFVGRENTPNDRNIVSMMAPKGLTSAVLASMPVQVNLAAGYEVIPNAALIQATCYAVIFFSIVLTSLMVIFTRKAYIDETLPYYESKEVYDYE